MTEARAVADQEDRYTRITLRIPKDLHQVLTAEAERTSKSLNAEIIGRLQGGGSSIASSRDGDIPDVVELAGQVGWASLVADGVLHAAEIKQFAALIATRERAAILRAITKRGCHA